VALLLSSMLVAASPAAAEEPPCDQSWFVPFDARQGAVLGRGSPAPYALGGHAALLYGVGQCGSFRFGPTAGVSFLNPGGEASGGGRLALRLWSPSDLLPEVGLYLEAEMSYTTEQRLPVDATLVFNASGLLRLGLWGSHDVDGGDTRLGIVLGVELSSLFVEERVDDVPDFGDDAVVVDEREPSAGAAGEVAADDEPDFGDDAVVVDEREPAAEADGAPNDDAPDPVDEDGDGDDEDEGEAVDPDEPDFD
jgi:hypothetical protein